MASRQPGAAASTLQVASPLGNGIGGGKPIQGSGIGALEAAEPGCQPSSLRATPQNERRVEKKGRKQQ